MYHMSLRCLPSELTISGVGMGYGKGKVVLSASGKQFFFLFWGGHRFTFFFLRLATSFYVDDWDGQHSFNIDDWDGQHFLCWWLKWVTIFCVDDWEAQHFLCWWQSWATNSGSTAGSKISYLRHCLPLFEIKPKKTAFILLGSAWPSSYKAWGLAGSEWYF